MRNKINDKVQVMKLIDLESKYIIPTYCIISKF